MLPLMRARGPPATLLLKRTTASPVASALAFSSGWHSWHSANELSRLADSRKLHSSWQGRRGGAGCLGLLGRGPVAVLLSQ